jgi:hypothetical protein
LVELHESSSTEVGNNKACKRKQKEESKKKKGKGKQQHLDFARPPGPHYYPGPDMLDFADRTGCGILMTVWPLVNTYPVMYI